MGVIYLNGIAYGGGGSGGTSDYEELTNKPSLNGVPLAQGQTLSDLEIADGITTYINEDNKLAIPIITTNQIQSLFN